MTSIENDAIFDAVIFDVGGVLTVSPLKTMGAMAVKYGIEPRLFAFIAAGAGAYDDGTHPWHRFERGEIDTATFDELTGELARAHGVVNFPPLPGPEFMELAMAPRPEIVALSDRARAEGLKTAILTNNVEPWTAWRQFVPHERFEVVIDSWTVGMRKPEAAIFHLAAEQLGVVPDRCLFLDDFIENCAGAEAVGMQAIHVDDTDRAAAQLAGYLDTRRAAGESLR